MITSELAGLVNHMDSIGELLKSASSALENAGIPDSRREASGLLESATGLTRTDVISDPQKIIEPELVQIFLGYVERRTKREPFQYIVGKKDFFGLEFKVDERVLIPRPETEILVEYALKKLSDVRSPFFCEVGVGSGCISVSILKNLSDAHAVGLDISIDAIEVASHNATTHGVSDRIRFIESDIFSENLYDAILSNPPYIAVDDLQGLEPEVKDYEPRRALTDDGSGLSLIKQIVDGAAGFLKDGGFVAIEIGFDQKEAVASMFSRDLWNDISFIKDLQGHYRIAVATRKARPASNSLPV